MGDAVKGRGATRFVVLEMLCRIYDRFNVVILYHTPRDDADRFGSLDPFNVSYIYLISSSIYMYCHVSKVHDTMREILLSDVLRDS